MNAQDFFAQLRSTLQGKPGQQTWDAFVALTEHAPDDAGFIDQIALPYARDHFNQWPAPLDACRLWSTVWLDHLSEGLQVPWGELARRVDLTFAAPSRQLTPRPLFAQLLPYAPFISHLSVSATYLHNPVDPTLLSNFLTYNNNALVSLQLRNIQGIYGEHVTNALSQHRLNRLKWLSLDAMAITDEALEPCLNQPWLANLSTLDLQHNALTDITLERLAQHPWRNLNTLLLLDNPIWGDALTAVANAKHLNTLRRLSLGQTTGGMPWIDPGSPLSHLWQSTNLNNLRSLSIHCTFMPASAADVLFHPTALGALERLDIKTGRALNDEECAALQQRLSTCPHADLLKDSIDAICTPQEDTFPLIPWRSHTEVDTPEVNTFMDTLPFTDPSDE